MSNRQQLELAPFDLAQGAAAERWDAVEEVDVRRVLEHPLRKLRAVILLGGAVRATGLRAGIARCVVDLPVDSQRTVIGYWREQCIQLAQALGARQLPVRLILDRSSSAPAHGWVADGRVMLAVERDPVEYRGTGGVLCDLARGYHPDDYVLIGNAAQVLCESLPGLTADLAAENADATIVSHADGTPSGLMLARCGALASLSRTGFIDLKEQALPQLARHHCVQVLEHARPSGLPIRTLTDYIEALRHHHRQTAGLLDDQSPMDDWKPAFALVEAGAVVHPSARLHDSVVLAGGRVEEGAVLVGSLVCPGGVVRRGKMAVDRLVGPSQKAGRSRLTR